MKDGVSDGELMGRNQYARHQGVSPGAVGKAVKSGRITRAVVWGPGGQVKAIRWRLADQLWWQNTDVGEAMKTRRSFPPTSTPAVQTSPQPVSSPPRRALPITEEKLGELLGLMFSDSLLTWCAFGVLRYQLAPAVALELIQDGLLVLAVAAGDRLGVDTDSFKLLLTGDLEEATVAEKRPAVIERIQRLAEQMEADLAQDATNGTGAA